MACALEGSTDYNTPLPSTATNTVCVRAALRDPSALPFKFLLQSSTHDLNSKIRMAPLIAALLFALMPCLSAVAAVSPWPFRGRSKQRDGNSGAIGPVTATLRWSWHFGYCFSSSPVIGSDGSVYIGASSACYPPSERVRQLRQRQNPGVTAAPPSPSFEPFPGDGN